MRITPAAGLAAGLLAVGGVPAARAAAQRYVAPTSQTVFSTTQESPGDNPAHVIYVENRSTVPVTVFSVTLSRCENVRQQCAPRSTKLRVRPGGRELAARVEPRNRELGFTYYFSFGWHPDSGAVTAVAAMASAGVTRAQEQLAGYRRADSLELADRARGVRVRQLSRDDFAALAGRRVALRTAPDSLLLAPGERADVDHILVLLADSTGTVLGRTRWIRWMSRASTAIQFTPPTTLMARNVGRTVLRFGLADEAQALLGREVDEVEVPVRVAYAADPHAPTFAGVAVDAARGAGAPLACADVALEDSAATMVARSRTDWRGAYRLAAPRPGTYRVRVEAAGWSPVYGPAELGAADATVTREVPVRFTEQLLAARTPWGDDTDAFQHAAPAAVSTYAPGARGPATLAPVMLGGSPTAPVLGVLTRGPAARTWMQFVVDSVGRVDLGSLSFAEGTAPATAAAVRGVLPRVRFSPARAAGRPTCELVRMEARVGAP